MVQCIGAVLGALALKLLFPVGIARLVSYGTPLIANTVTLPQAIGIEALLTFLLMSAVFGTAVSATAPRVGGFVIGLTVYPLHSRGGHADRARHQSCPRVRAGGRRREMWVGHIAYWIGPILGAVIAAVLWDRVLLPPREATVAA